MTIKKTTTYTTEDGKIFFKQIDATKHQEELNKQDYKKLYYELLKKHTDIQSKYDLEKRFGKQYPTSQFIDAVINKK